MRSRPALKVYIDPPVPKPGDVLRVTAVLQSRSATPVDGIEFTLMAAEEVHVADSAGALVGYTTHCHLVARHAGVALTPGEHRYEALFPLPVTMPPSYDSDRSHARCLLTVRVDIPWWPDRVGEYVIPIGLAPQPSAPRPGVFTTHREGPFGRDLYAECSVDSTLLEPGGVVRGAVSLTNVAEARGRSLRVALVQTEAQRPDGASPRSWEVGRYEFTLAEGATEAESVPFCLVLPRNLTPSFVSARIGVHWFLEVGLHGLLGDRALLSVPVTVVPPGSLPPQALVAAPPSVGRQRRQQVWAPVAARHGLTYDNARDAVVSAFGDVHVTIVVEQRLRDGLFTVATIRYEALGLALELGPAQWNDRFSLQEIEVGDSAFDAAFRVRGRFAEQVRALLDPVLRAAMPRGVELQMTDDSAIVATRGALSDAEVLGAFFGSVSSFARALEHAARAIPVPSQVAEKADAWRALASRTQGRFEAGRCVVHGLRYGVDRMDAGYAWDDDGKLLGVRVTMRLDPPRPTPPSPAELDAVKDAWRRDAVALRALTATAESLTAVFDATQVDPSSLEPLLDRVARAGRKLLGRDEAGPYR